MKRPIMDVLGKVEKTFYGSPIAEIPGVRPAFRRIVALAESEYEEGEQWIDYEGYCLKISPPDRVSRRLAKRGYYEPKVTETIKTHVSSGDLVIDIGSHIGHHTLTLRSCVGESGRVIAIDPNPEAIEHLSKTAAENGLSNVITINKALAANSGVRELSIERDNTGNASLGSVEGRDAKTIDVEAISVEGFINDNEVDRVDFVKMDVQGLESEIIDSLDLNRVSKMILEVHGEKLSDPQIQSLFDVLSRYGTVSGLDGEKITAPEDLNYDQDQQVFWTTER